MLKENLIMLRNLSGYSQEEIAENLTSPHFYVTEPIWIDRNEEFLVTPGILDRMLQGREGVVRPETARDMIRFRQMNRWDRRGVMFQLRILDTDAHSFPLGRQTFGHTGFTGTCLWCDPDRELCFALMTNDGYNGRENRTTGRLRKAIVEELVSAIDKEDTCK